MGTIYKDGINYSGGGSGNTNSVALTQAEYDALSEAEKNSDTVYFITDAGGSDNVFVIHGVQDGSGIVAAESYADILAARNAEKIFTYYGPAHNYSQPCGVSLQSDAQGNFIGIHLLQSYILYYCKVYEDGTKTPLEVKENFSDTGWVENGVLQYRKRNGFVTLNLVSVFNSAIAPGGNILGTLPDGYRPAFSNQTNRIDFAAIVTPTGVTTDKTACNVGIGTDGIVTLFSPKDIPATTGIRGCVTYPV